MSREGEVKESSSESVMRMSRGSEKCISSGKSVENKTQGLRLYLLINRGPFEICLFHFLGVG